MSEKVVLNWYNRDAGWKTATYYTDQIENAREKYKALNQDPENSSYRLELIVTLALNRD